MIPSKPLNLNRRSFLVGGSLCLVGAAVALSGCNHKVGNKNSFSRVINASLSCADTNYNPVGSNSTLMISAGWHVLECLYDYEAKTFDIKPVLADGQPEVIDELHYVVKIRDGAMYSNGAEVTSYDVVNAFEMNRISESYKSYLNFIKSVQSDGRQHVKFEFKYPIGKLFQARSCMVRIYPASLTDQELKTKPIGSGPWAYSSIDGKDGGVISFIPNKYYNGQFSAGDISMYWTITTDDQSRISKLNTGSADVIDDIAVASAKYPISEDMIVNHGLGNYCTYMMFNTLKDPFGDKRVRQAIHYAINTEGIINDLKEGYGSPASCILSTAHGFYSKASNVYDYNVERAKQLLEEANVSDLSLTLMIDNDYTSGIADYVKANLEDIGIKCKTQITSINWNNLNESGAILPFDIIIASGDPSSIGTDADLLMSWQYEDNVWMNGRSCYKKSDPQGWSEINSLMQEAREASDSDKKAAYQKCFDKISEEVPIYPIYHREIGNAYNPKKLKSYESLNMAGVSLVNVELYS